MLRVNTSRIAARTLVEPHLAELLSRYPQLRVELVMDDGLANIIADGCDAGIRLGESLAEHMVAVPITPMLEMAVIGSPGYFEQHGKPSTPAELVKHNCLSYRHTSSGAIFRWEFATPDDENHTFAVEPQGSLITNDDDGMIRAALQGIGLAQHMDHACASICRRERWFACSNHGADPFPGFYFYAPSREQMPAKVRALMAFLIEKRDGLGAQSIGRQRKAAAVRRAPRVSNAKRKR